MSDPHLLIAKQRMLRKHLRGRGIHDERVLAAMAKVPRERFVPASVAGEAYADRALPIDCGQTISQPYIVALMTQALGLSGQQRVLEVGTGSGYQAAVLAELAGQVLTIERHPLLAEKARAVLDALGVPNVEVVVGDGTLGWPAQAPFDCVMVTATALSCPPALVEQLVDGGILVIPLGNPDCQSLVALHKHGAVADRQQLSPCRFVPLIGAQGWPA